MSYVTHLECSVCGRQREAGKIHNLCECGGPLLVRYDLDKAKAGWKRESLASAPKSPPKSCGATRRCFRYATARTSFRWAKA